MGSKTEARASIGRLVWIAAVAVVGCAAPHGGRTFASVAVTQPSVPAWEVLGTSRNGRPIRALTLEGAPFRSEAPRRVALIASIHGNEREGARHLPDLLDQLVTHLSSQPGTVRVYEDVNPDGTSRNDRRTSRGVDPNRNWPAKNFLPARDRGPKPLSEPGVAAVHGDLEAFAPELVIVLHSTSRGPFVNFDGPARPYARAFSNAAGSPWTVQPSMGYPTPGSFGSWMGVDGGIPTLTIEFERGCSEAASWPALSAGIHATLGMTGVTATAEREPFVVD
jgi:protein MpaA